MYDKLSLDKVYEIALGKSFKYLSFRARSEKEVRDYLSKKEIPEIIINQTIQKLQDMKYLDDDEFTTWWIEQRQGPRPKSKLFIKLELKQKGIADTIIEKHLNNSQNDLETAKKLFTKKQRTFERYTGDTYKQKVSQFLARRGFSWDIIKEVLKNEE